MRNKESEDASSKKSGLSGSGWVYRGFALGAVGLICGYVGPLVYCPSCNQGPLMGIFVTGPAAFVGGLAAGWGLDRLKIGRLLREVIFAALVVGTAIVTLELSRPGPVLTGILIDGEVTRCESPVNRLPSAIRQWKTTIAANPQLSVWPNWESERGAAVRSTKGVMIEVAVRGERDIYEERSGSTAVFRAGDWTARRFSWRYFADFAGQDCSGYRAGEQIIFWTAATVHHEEPVPPANIPDFLELEMVSPVPEQFKRFVDERRALPGTPSDPDRAAAASARSGLTR